MLALALSPLSLDSPLILAIPSGGVPVALQVAQVLGGDLDVVLAKKIGAPSNPEFAVAAVDASGFVTHPSSGCPQASPSYIEKQAAVLAREVQDSLRAYRMDREAIPVAGRHVVVVDDGLATGLTAIAALSWVRRQGPRRLVLAVPVSPQDTLDLIRSMVDDLVCPHIPRSFWAVGQFYKDFQQVPVDEARRILASF